MSETDILETHLQELRRGTIVLACLRLLEHPGYGYGLLEQLGAHGFPTDANTLYPLLRRLESQGLLGSEWRVDAGPPRRYYALSAEGRRTLKTLVGSWQGLNEAMDRLLEDR